MIVVAAPIENASAPIRSASTSGVSSDSRRRTRRSSCSRAPNVTRRCSAGAAWVEAEDAEARIVERARRGQQLILVTAVAVDEDDRRLRAAPERTGRRGRHRCGSSPARPPLRGGMVGELHSYDRTRRVNRVAGRLPREREQRPATTTSRTSAATATAGTIVNGPSDSRVQCLSFSQMHRPIRSLVSDGL